jgi:hypothetical protein
MRQRWAFGGMDGPSIQQLGDEPLIAVKTIHCFLVLMKVQFYFFQMYCRRVAPLYVKGIIPLHICQRLFATV